MANEDFLENREGFDWDNGNINKNWLAHRVSDGEAEEVFFYEPSLVFEDIKHSQQESRYYCLGQTSQSRKLFIVFTIRDNKIRIISARDMSKEERKQYAKEIQKDSTIS